MIWAPWMWWWSDGDLRSCLMTKRSPSSNPTDRRKPPRLKLFMWWHIWKKCWKMDQKTLLGSFPAWQHMYVLVQWNCWPVARNRRKMWPGSFGSTGFFDSKIHRRQQVTRWVMEADCSFWKLAVRCVLRLAGSLGWTDEILDSATNWSIDPFVCIITCHYYCLTFLIQNTLVYCVSNN